MKRMWNQQLETSASSVHTQGDGSVAKCTDWSEHPHGSSQPHIVPDLGDPNPFPGLMKAKENYCQNPLNS